LGDFDALAASLDPVDRDQLVQHGVVGPIMADVRLGSELALGGGGMSFGPVRGGASVNTEARRGSPKAS
jgi:hypothetical protein